MPEKTQQTLSRPVLKFGEIFLCSFFGQMQHRFDLYIAYRELAGNHHWTNPHRRQGRLQFQQAVLPLDKRLRRIPWGDGRQGAECRGKDRCWFTGRDWGRNSVSGIAYGGQAYPANHPAENAGLFHKGNCPACRIDNKSYLCKARPLAEKAAKDFISI